MKVSQMVRTLAAAASLLAVCGTAAAQAGAYPVKPIRFLVGVAPGGGTDFVAPPLQASWPSDSARRSLRTIAPVRRARRARNGRQGAARRLHVRRLQHRPSDFGAAREDAAHRSRAGLRASQPDRDWHADARPQRRRAGEDARSVIAYARTRSGQLNCGSSGQPL